MGGKRRKSNVQFLPETGMTSPRWYALVLSFCEKLQFYLERTEKYIMRGKHHILFSLQLTQSWLLFLCSLHSGLGRWKYVQLGSRMGYLGCMYTALCTRLVCPHFRQFWQLLGKTIFSSIIIQSQKQSAIVFTIVNYVPSLILSEIFILMS